MATEIPNLDSFQERRSKRAWASYLMRQALKSNDALQMSSAAALWRELGEEETAQKCEEHARIWMLVESDPHKRMI